MTDSGTVVLTVLVDCWLGDAGQQREFYVAAGGGYVYEIEYRQSMGRRGQQVCTGLHRHGATLWSTRDDLPARIRAEARRCLRAEARAEARY